MVFFVLYTVYSLFKSRDLIQYLLHLLLSGPVDSADSHSEAVLEEALRNSGAGSASAQSGHSGEMEMCLGIINCSFTL